MKQTARQRKELTMANNKLKQPLAWYEEFCDRLIPSGSDYYMKSSDLHKQFILHLHMKTDYTADPETKKMKKKPEEETPNSDTSSDKKIPDQETSRYTAGQLKCAADSRVISDILTRICV